MTCVLAMITGAEFGLLAAASAMLGTIVGGCSKRRRRDRPEKSIEITVQRIDRPYRPCYCRGKRR